MRALVMTDFGAPVALADIPAPHSVAPGEVLVRVHAASLSRFDVNVSAGLLESHLEHLFPVTLGRDFAGVIEQVGSEVHGFAVGDAVAGLIPGITLHDGAVAEYVVVDAVGHLSRLPHGVDRLCAATLPVAGTVAMAMVEAVEPGPGDRVLIVGATGGVGSFAVQLAAARGAYVIATGRPDDQRYLRELGAAEAVDYRGDLHAALRQRHPDGVQALIDAVSDDVGACTELAAHVIAGGRVASPNLAADLAGLAAAGITGTNVMADLAADGTLDRIVVMLDDGRLRAPELRVFELSQAPAALECLRLEHTRGKVVVQFVI